MSTKTFKEQLEHLTHLQHRLAVWEAIYQLADEKLISKDGRKVSGIKVKDCIVELVPEETIEEILQAMSDGPIAEITEAIKEIESQQLVVIGEAKASA